MGEHVLLCVFLLCLHCVCTCVVCFFSSMLLMCMHGVLLLCIHHVCACMMLEYCLKDWPHFAARTTSNDNSYIYICHAALYC